MFSPDDILYEDNHLLVVNKHSGDLVQPDPSGESALEDQIKAFLKARDAKPGQVFCETGKNDTLALSTERMQPCPYVYSDTYGMEIGDRVKYALPIAVTGRALVCVEGNRGDYHLGDVLCAAPGGLACKMTREEVREYPDRILGVVCGIPDYETYSEIVPVNGRIWIKI